MRRSIICAAIAIATAPASAQDRDFSKVEIKVEQLAPGVAVLFGAGGNIGLSYGEDGNALIDDQFAPLTPKILAAVKGLDPGPVRFVINTHWHGDHVGGNENLGQAGAVIVAHDNVRRRMSVDQIGAVLGKTPASPKVALPVVTFADALTMHLNGQNIRVIHVANAHTDGDVLLWFEQAKVLHMGDTFFNKISLPFIDLESGGSIDGAIAAVRTALAMVPADAKIIPGHGPVASKSDLESYLGMLTEVRAKVDQARKAGRSLDEIKAMKIAAAYEVKDGFISGDSFVDTVYRSLENPPR